MPMLIPKVIPIKELKNTSNISKICKETQVPIIITKNGYSDMVLMNVDLYEKTIAKMQAAFLINESMQEVEKGLTPIDGKSFFNAMKEKYAK